MQETLETWIQSLSLGDPLEDTAVFLPGESHGQRSLASYSPWGCKESDTTEQLTHTTETGLGVGLHVTKIIKLRKIQTELKQSGLISCMSHPKRVMICLFQR